MYNGNLGNGHSNDRPHTLSERKSEMRFIHISENRNSHCNNKAFKMRRNSDNSCWMRVISIGILLQILANCGKSQFFPTFNVNPFIIGRSSSRRVTRSATAIYSEHCSTRSNSFQFYLILRQVICVVTIFGLIQWYGLNAVRISSSGRIIILKLFVFFLFVLLWSPVNGWMTILGILCAVRRSIMLC